MFNNAYQNLELKIDLSSGGTIAGLKEKIKSILGNKILILCGLLISGVQQLPAVCEPKIYVTQTEEPEDWDEEEDGEFVTEDVYHLEASNIYGYDIEIEDDVVTCTATQSATYAGVEALISGGTLDNAKPIYWHSVTLKRVASNILDFYADLIIINNDPTPFTLTSFYNFVKSLPDAEFKIVQGYYIDDQIGVISYLKYYDQETPRAIEFFSINKTTGEVVSHAYSIDAEGTMFTDNGVNKLN